MSIIELPTDQAERLHALGEMEDFITLVEGEDYWLDSEYIPLDTHDYPHLLA